MKYYLIKADGHRFLGLSRFDLYIYNLEKSKMVTGLSFAESLGWFDAELQRKRLHLSKKCFPPLALDKWERHRTTGSRLLRHQDGIGWIWLRTTTAPSTTVFARFGPVRLLFVSKLEKVTGEPENLVIDATEAYFADLEETYFWDGLKNLKHLWIECIELKGYTYKAMQNKSTYFSKVFVFLLQAKYLSDCPRILQRLTYMVMKVIQRWSMLKRGQQLTCR